MRRWLIRIAAVFLGLGVTLALALAVAVLGWRYPTARLAPGAASSLSIVDRSGRLLRQTALDTGGRASWVRLHEMPPLLVAATLASEDDRFHRHAGVDPLALGRAAWLDLQRGRFAFGGSTITMQLVRMVDAHPRKSLSGKLADVVRALRLERELSKEEILEQYLNRACYGNGAFGVEAAARLYFDRPARSLSAGEATLLAVLPRAPTGYDPLRHLDAALGRRRHVLGLLAGKGQLVPEERARIEATPLAVARGDSPRAVDRGGPARPAPPFRAPHFVDLVLAGLPDPVRRSGGVVRTTLDLPLQERLEAAVRAHVAALKGQHVEQAGVVVLDGASGAVRALVGSVDHRGARAGQVDVLTTPRNPGSSLKPFVYALALEQGDTPATIAWDLADVPSGYRTRNADGRQHGPVRYRAALAGSYNLAAVHVAERIGTGPLLEHLRAAGLATLARPPEAYGPALALGNGQVRLLDLAAAYGFLTHGGHYRPARTVLRVEIPGAPTWRPPAAPPRRLYSPEVSWLVMDMLADAQARRPAFGDDLPLDLPFPVAAKTGTSGGFADNVAVIATREHLVLAWAGNFDGTPMHRVLAMWGAAPLARAAVLAAADYLDGGRAPTLPPAPAGVVTRPVCALSGKAPGPACPHKLERFAAGTAPVETCDWHRAEGGRVVVDWPRQARAWAERQRRAGGQVR